MTQPAVSYETRATGVLDDGWSAWFDGLHVTSDDRAQTTVAGPVVDQAALHGLLATVRDRGLELRLAAHRPRLTTRYGGTRCTGFRAQDASLELSYAGSCGPSGSTGAGRPAWPTDVPPPVGSCPTDTRRSQ